MGLHNQKWNNECPNNGTFRICWDNETHSLKTGQASRKKNLTSGHLNLVQQYVLQVFQVPTYY